MASKVKLTRMARAYLKAMNRPAADPATMLPRMARLLDGSVSPRYSGDTAALIAAGTSRRSTKETK